MCSSDAPAALAAAAAASAFAMLCRAAPFSRIGLRPAGTPKVKRVANFAELMVASMLLAMKIGGTVHTESDDRPALATLAQ